MIVASSTFIRAMIMWGYRDRSERERLMGFCRYFKYKYG